MMALTVPVTVPGQPGRALWWRRRPVTKTAAADISGRTHSANILPHFPLVRRYKNLDRKVGSDKQDNYSPALSYLGLGTNGTENFRRILTHSILS